MTAPSSPDSEDPVPDQTVIVNGEPRAVVGLTLAELVVELGLPPTGRGVAVAVAGDVVPRGAWAERPLAAGERVEVLTAIQGG